MSSDPWTPAAVAERLRGHGGDAIPASAIGAIVEALNAERLAAQRAQRALDAYIQGATQTAAMLHAIADTYGAPRTDEDGDALTMAGRLKHIGDRLIAALDTNHPAKAGERSP